MTDTSLPELPAAAVDHNQSRIERWAQKLLDLSLSNRLLNLKDSKKVVPLLCPDVVALEDKIAANEAFSVKSVAELLGEEKWRDFQRERADFDRAALDASLASEMDAKRLWTRLAPQEAQRRLKELYRLAKSDLEESGVNTLFLAVGFLEWRTDDSAARSCRAPILLIPIRLERKMIADGIRLLRLDEDTVANTTLLELLRTQFGIAVRDINPLPTDTSGVDVTRVLDKFREAVAGRKGWAVVEEAVIGQFSFGKFVMWKDMTERMDDFRKNPLVAHLVGGGGTYDDGIEVFPPSEIARHIDYSSLYCPMPADSSQLTAVLYSALGKTFVLHGPPGTGKSQTITNLIAHNLALGRKVLFVSEKKAALDVVYRRLSSIGLAPFCLELHSNKAGKADVLAQFAAALKVGESAEPAEWAQTASSLEALRGELNAYVASLHGAHPNGISAYRCLCRLMDEGPSRYDGCIEVDCMKQTAAEYAAMEESAEAVATAAAEVPSAAIAAFAPVKDAAWSLAFERELCAAVSAAREALSRIGAPGAALPETLAAAASALSPFFAEGPASPAAFLPAFAAASRRRCEAADALATFNLSEVADLDIKSLEERIRVNAEKFCVARFFGERRIARELRALKKPLAAALSFKELAGRLDDFAAFQAADAALRAAEERVPSAVAALNAALDAVSTNLEHLRRVFAYRDARSNAAKHGLAALVAKSEAGDFPPSELAAQFRLAYATKMLNAIFAADRSLSGFSAAGHEARIARFRDLDAEWTRLAAKMAFARIAARLAEHMKNAVRKPARTSPLGILRHECEKKMRHKPVRQLLAEIGSLATALKPCFLMSPLSVAQYLSADDAKFDLVVFDEASQIPVWDAIGVLARAPQAVIVGDPKQMPPTNFFQKGESPEDFDETAATVEDLESILDECLAAGVYSSYLSWHYRSRHESLISFSNHNYYGDSLFTFPSASESDSLGVRFRLVENGVYDRKATRTNENEAKALVDYVFETLGASGRRRSMGVVTFSEAQKNLIEDMIESRREQDPRFEDYFAADGVEPFFVKNLDNVQGDERDVILFSMCYAPDASGKFAMNFGPLNKAGGERRLNVAVTRAKEQIVVFSSIRGSQIDLSRTSALGAAQLRDFIEYAAGETRAAASLAPAAPAVAAPAEKGAAATRDAFADAVAAFLAANGYATVRDVGRSGCKVDIAVRDPKRPDRFFAGIACDGGTYARPATARDRDAQLPSVFASLGWHMLHVWSVDWTFDRPKAEQRLLDALRSCSAAAAGGHGTDRRG